MTTTNKYLIKLAQLSGQATPPAPTKLKAHHAEALDQLEKNDSLIANHSLGSGKTLLGLKAIERGQLKHPNERSLFVAPASLVSNASNEIKKHGLNIDTSKMDITTYDKLVNNVDEHLKNKYHTVVIDEGQKVRNIETQRAQKVREILMHARKKLTLTGTPNYNSHRDIATLVNTSAGHKVLPEGKAFDERYIEERKEVPNLIHRVMGLETATTKHLKHKDELKSILSKHVHTYDGFAEDPASFAKKHEHVVHVEMSSEQSQHYKYLEKDLPLPLRMKIRMGMPLSKKESSGLNAFSTGVRQIANTHTAYKKGGTSTTPKITKMADDIEEGLKKNTEHRSVAYSNYLESGLHPLSAELKKRGIQHELFTGAMTKKEKDELVNRYNTGQNKVLLLSSSGSEGLSLKGVRQIGIMEPHFNKKKIDQVIGRGVRYQSHNHLPETDRHVDVNYYLSTRPNKYLGMVKDHGQTIDQYLHHYSREKEKLSDEVMSLAN